MPADDLYWNPMDLDTDESLPYPKQYIDPWDLENYAYIRQHLDSVDLNSDPSSLGETQDANSAFYYIPAKSPSERYEPISPPHENDIYYVPKPSRVTEKIYDSKHDDYYYLRPFNNKFSERYDMTSEHGTANYTAIDELVIKNEAVSRRRRQSECMYDKNPRKQRFHPEFSGNYNYFEHPYETGLHDDSMAQEIYEKPEKHSRNTRKYNGGNSVRSRSHSFSVGDYEYESFKATKHQPQQTYHRVDEIYSRGNYDSAGSSPIYDDIRSHKPKHFKLSNYGHLQIDYSCSWNNLNKYIYN